MLPKGSISRVHEYYFTTPRFNGEIMRALREFFDRPDLDTGGHLQTSAQSEAFFNEWFLYDFVLDNGHTVLEDFIVTNPLHLKNKEMELYRNLIDNWFGIFEVISIELGHRITVKDLQTGKLWTVWEYKATFELQEGHVFLGRIGEVGDHYELIGADSFSLQDVDEATKKSFLGDKLKLTPKEANAIFEMN